MPTAGSSHWPCLGAGSGGSCCRNGEQRVPLSKWAGTAPRHSPAGTASCQRVQPAQGELVGFLGKKVPNTKRGEEHKIQLRGRRVYSVCLNPFRAAPVVWMAPRLVCLCVGFAWERVNSSRAAEASLGTPPAGIWKELMCKMIARNGTKTEK